MKTLGICIPTYKRPAFLKRCVLSAIEAAQGKPIRIFITDDSVSDVNQAVVSELMAQYPFIFFQKNSVNLGIDGNIQEAVSLCDCDYAWLIGEDDTFLPGAIARMHDTIQSVKLSFIFTNYAFVGNDPSAPLGKAQLDVAEGEMSAGEFLSKHLWAVGFIGACVIQREMWEQTFPEPYAGTYYTHVGRIAEMISSADGVYISENCSVANRVEGGGSETFTWWNDSYGVFFGFVNMCKSAEARCPKHAASLIQAGKVFESRFLTLRLAVRLRAEHSYNYGQYQKYLKNYQGLSIFKKLILELISIVPPLVFQPIMFVYRLVR